MLTYKVFERKIDMTGIAEGSLLPLPTARAVYATIRGEHGFEPVPGSFLTDETGNEKLAKGEGTRLLMLALAPHSTSGVADVCPFSTEGCRKGCVAFAGNGSFPAVLRARQARTAFLLAYPLAFLTLLVDLIDRESKRGAAAVRLNGFSDIRWERVLPEWFWSRWENVVFYDYTKHTVRSRPSLPDNYKLTFSATSLTSDRELANARKAGRSVAVVLSVAGGIDHRTGELRPIPGGLVDGDKNDRRFDDAPGSVVGLRRKGSAKLGNDLIVSDERVAKLVGA